VKAGCCFIADSVMIAGLYVRTSHRLNGYVLTVIMAQVL